MKFNSKGKSHSVDVPPEQAGAIKAAHAAWLRFGGLAAAVSAANRERLLRDLERQKVAARVSRVRARKGR